MSRNNDFDYELVEMIEGLIEEGGLEEGTAPYGVAQQVIHQGYNSLTNKQKNVYEKNVVPHLKKKYQQYELKPGIASDQGGMILKINLYKVYVQTEDHPHILEMIVAGNSIDDAKEKALKHVKESNPTKGRKLKISQNNSTVLAAKKTTGRHGALVINKMPAAIYTEIIKKFKTVD